MHLNKEELNADRDFNLTQTIEYFQKNPVDEPKNKSKGEIAKPRGISSSYTVLKGKSVHRYSRAKKEVISSWYNLYVNYISALFIECIKRVQKYADDD
jgi:hypothetical protein